MMKQKTVRIWMVVVSNILIGIAVGFMLNADFGTDCYQSMVLGLSNLFKIEFGTISVIVNCVLMVFMLLCGRKLIGVNTFVNMFLLGYIVQYSNEIIAYFAPAPDMTVRIGFLLVGIVVLCFAAGMYFVADLGVSTYDSIALMADAYGILKFRYCRICCDLSCAFIGFVLGVNIGIGTLVAGFMMGPMIDFFRKKLFEPFLAKFPVETAA